MRDLTDRIQLLLSLPESGLSIRSGKEKFYVTYYSEGFTGRAITEQRDASLIFALGRAITLMDINFPGKLKADELEKTFDSHLLAILNHPHVGSINFGFQDYGFDKSPTLRGTVWCTHHHGLWGSGSCKSIYYMMEMLTHALYDKAEIMGCGCGDLLNRRDELAAWKKSCPLPSWITRNDEVKL